MASFHPWELAWKEGRWYEVSPAFRPVIEFSDHLKRVGGRTVLDLGCGAGRHSIYLAKQGFHVVGFDISLFALRKLRTRLRAESVENVKIVNSEMSKLPFADGVFDAVVSTNVLHHTLVAGIEQAVEEVRRVMNTGAEGFLMTLSEHDYKNGTGRLLEPGTYVLTEGDEQGIVHHFFSEEELLSHFGKFGIISVQEELIPSEKGPRGHFHLRFRKGRAE